MGLYSYSKSQSTNPLSKYYVNNNSTPSVPVLPMVSGYEGPADIAKLNFSVYDSPLGSLWKEKEQERELIKYYNEILPLIMEEIEKIDSDLLPKGLTEHSGTLKDFFLKGKSGDLEEFSRSIYEVIMAEEEVTQANNADSMQLTDFYRSTKTRETAAVQRSKTKKKLTELQTKMAEASERYSNNLQKLCEEICPGLKIGADGNFDLSQADLNNFYLSPENLEKINTVVRDYKKEIQKFPKSGYIFSFYSHDAFESYRNDIPFGRRNKNFEAASQFYNSGDKDSIYQLLGALSDVNMELKRDNDRAERFTSGENFWPNDNSAGTYSAGVNDGTLALNVPAVVKMATIYGQDFSRPIYSGTGEFLDDNRQKVAREIAGVVLHEFGHHISQSANRVNVEQALGFSFKDFSAIHEKITSIGAPSQSLFDEFLGSYAMHNPNELYSESLKFLYSSPEKREKIRRNFAQYGLQKEFEFLLKSIGL